MEFEENPSSSAKIEIDLLPESGLFNDVFPKNEEEHQRKEDPLSAVDETTGIDRILDQPIIDRNDIDRFLQQYREPSILESLNQMRKPAELSGNRKAWNIEDIDLSPSRFNIPAPMESVRSFRDFSRAQPRPGRRFRLNPDTRLPGRSDGTFNDLQFQSKTETLVEKIDGIGRFNFETQKGRKIELEVLRDCGPGDYGLCITAEL